MPRLSFQNTLRLTQNVMRVAAAQGRVAVPKAQELTSFNLDRPLSIHVSSFHPTDFLAYKVHQDMVRKLVASAVLNKRNCAIGVEDFGSETSQEMTTMLNQANVSLKSFMSVLFDVEMNAQLKELQPSQHEAEIRNFLEQMIFQQNLQLFRETEVKAFKVDDHSFLRGIVGSNNFLKLSKDEQDRILCANEGKRSDAMMNAIKAFLPLNPGVDKLVLCVSLERILPVASKLQTTFTDAKISSAAIISEYFAEQFGEPALNDKYAMKNLADTLEKYQRESGIPNLGSGVSKTNLCVVPEGREFPQVSSQLLKAIERSLTSRTQPSPSPSEAKTEARNNVIVSNSQ